MLHPEDPTIYLQFQIPSAEKYTWMIGNKYLRYPPKMLPILLDWQYTSHPSQAHLEVAESSEGHIQHSQRFIKVKSQILIQKLKTFPQHSSLTSTRHSARLSIRMYHCSVTVSHIRKFTSQTQMFSPHTHCRQLTCQKP